MISRGERSLNRVCKMPIYEYQTTKPGNTCSHCGEGFEIIQNIEDKPLSSCPKCGKGVKKIISWCRAAITETPAEQVRVERQIREYEASGMWSHAAELADTHSEKTKDTGLKTRALDNYKKAGYDVDSLAKHIKNE